MREQSSIARRPVRDAQQRRNHESAGVAGRVGLEMERVCEKRGVQAWRYDFDEWAREDCLEWQHETAGPPW
jgi:hypothetical protein